MVSRPAFNPNLFAKGISNKDWQEINNNPFDPMTNKAISGQYPPGSTFKVVTGSAALDLHKVDPEELIFDSGHHWIIPMGNAGGEALGWINFQTAFAASDNVYFYEMGRRVGIDNLDAYAAKYGFGSTTGVDLPGEEPGLIPSPAAKQKVFGEEWGLGDTFNSAIGQGLTLVTPIQLAQMLSIVANNGVLKQPYLVEKVLNEDGSVLEVPKHKDPVNVGISKETLALIQKGLAGVTQAGGTASYFSNLGIPIAGKTGTAENPHGQDHGLFIAYAPLDNPELVIAAVVEQGSYGSTASGPIVYKLLEAMLKEKD
jgi:penicillin-binding protein 2